MYVYLTPRLDDLYEADRVRMGAIAHRVNVFVLAAGSTTTLARVVRALTENECKGLILPDDYRRHNELIEHAKAIAKHLGFVPVPLTHHLAKQQTKPVAASAVPPTQHPAAAGKPIAPAQAGASPSEAHRTALQH
ncbi:MAG TPA: hypothetical protein PLB89_05385 [Flavobacteriales bacterium]|nr:hypothetical protein [Flavobacteriales bacterium]